MRSRSSSTRFVFLLLLTAIAAVFVVGRLWIQHPSPSTSTEAGLVPHKAEPGDQHP